MNADDPVFRYRMDELEKDIAPFKELPGRVKAIEDNQSKLETSINRLTWAIVGFAFTVAGSAVALLIAGGATPS